MVEGLTVEELARLKAIAEKATPGPWVTGYWSGQCHIDHKHGGAHGGCVYDYELNRADDDFFGRCVVSAMTRESEICGTSDYGPIATREDAIFVAAFNPQQALALITQVERLTAERDEARASLFHARQSTLTEGCRADTLAAENERLRTALIEIGRYGFSQDATTQIARTALAAGEPAR